MILGGCQLIKQFVLVITIAAFVITPARLAKAQLHRVGPPDIYPDLVVTPGAANPRVTQRNIGETICNRHWSTKLIRPPAESTKVPHLTG